MDDELDTLCTSVNSSGQRGLAQFKRALLVDQVRSHCPKN